MQNHSALELRNISKSFPGVAALRDISLSIPKGGAHALIGENGAGKSTLLKILTANETPDGGAIYLDGEQVQFDGPRAARHAGIAMIHQELQLVPYMTVAQNLFLGAVPTHRGVFTDRRVMESRGRKALSELGADIDVRARVGDLSVADKQLVEIARALMWNARIVAMDEPTSALTEKEFAALARLIRSIRAKGVTIIYVSHKLDEIAQVCDTGTVLRDGQVVAQIDIASKSQTEIVSLMVGRHIEMQKRVRRQGSETILEARGLCWKNRIRDISVEVRRGEVLGIAGLVGAGRTEFIRLLAGLEQPDRGEICMKGEPIRFRNRAAATQLGIGFVPEDRKKEAIIPFRTVLANVGLPVLKRFAPFGVVATHRLRKGVEYHLEDVRLRPMNPDTQIKKFSGGNQQKAIIARWLLSNAEVLIFDEPTRGIDVGAKQEIYDLIDRLVDQGKAIVVVSSELPEIIRLSDRVLVIREGSCAGVLTAEESDEKSIMDLAVPLGSGYKGGNPQ